MAGKILEKLEDREICLLKSRQKEYHFALHRMVYCCPGKRLGETFFETAEGIWKKKIEVPRNCI